jgi:cold shock CspA family protein
MWVVGERRADGIGIVSIPSHVKLVFNLADRVFVGLAHRDASTTQVPSRSERRPSPRLSSHRAGAEPTEACLGSVKSFDIEKGFGFVAADRGGKDVFVHATTLDQSGLSGLPECQRVRMQICQGQKGPEARSIELLGLTRLLCGGL